MTPTVRPTQTPFIRLDRRIGWRLDPRLTTDLFTEAASGVLRLGSPEVTPISPLEPFGTFGGMTLPTGLTIHPDGQVLLADPQHNRILYYIPPFGAGTRPSDGPDCWPFKPLWPVSGPESPANGCTTPVPAPPEPFAEPYRLNRPGDVTFSPAGDLVMADSGNARVLCLAWPGLQVRRILHLPGGQPAAVAFDSHGDGYVADAAAGRVLRFDSRWKIDEKYEGGAGHLKKPQHLAIDQDDTVFVLDTAAQALIALDERGRPVIHPEGGLLSPAELGLFERRFIAPLRLTEGVLEYPQLGRPRCPPMVLNGVRVDRTGRLQGTLLPLLARPQRVALPRSGLFVSECLDAGTSGTQWHRLVLESRLEPSTRLIVQTYTSELPLESGRVSQLDQSDWSSPMLLNEMDLPEVLVQSPPGRYLWLRLEFTGDGEHTPRVAAIEIHAPRRSSHQWLPPVFRNDAESARFLDRLLSYFDTVFAEIEYEIEQFPRLLDPYSVPAGPFLEWLGAWFDWRFLAQWPETVRREMIARSISFFRIRGTIAGLRQLLQWHSGLTGDWPQVIEHFRARDYAERREPPLDDLPDGRLHIGGKPLITDETGIAHWFTIVMPASAVPDSEAKDTLQRLIEAQKPAHTACQLRIIGPGLRIGCQSTVGVDTWLGEYPAEPLGGMKLGQSSRLGRPSSPPGLKLDSGQSIMNT